MDEGRARSRDLGTYIAPSGSIHDGGLEPLVDLFVIRPVCPLALGALCKCATRFNMTTKPGTA